MTATRQNIDANQTATVMTSYQRHLGILHANGRGVVRTRRESGSLWMPVSCHVLFSCPIFMFYFHNAAVPVLILMLKSLEAQLQPLQNRNETTQTGSQFIEHCRKHNGTHNTQTHKDYKNTVKNTKQKLCNLKTGMASHALLMLQRSRFACPTRDAVQLRVVSIASAFG